MLDLKTQVRNFHQIFTFFSVADDGNPGVTSTSFVWWRVVV